LLSWFPSEYVIFMQVL